MSMDSTTDHDLLIRLDTRFGNIENEMRLLRDGTSKDIATLVDKKLDRQEFIEFKLQHDAVQKEKADDVNREIGTVQVNFGRLVVKTDWLLKVDYGFLRSKPIYPSLFDLMPDWPWYLPVLVVLGVISMLIFYAPFFIADLVRRKPR